MLSKQIKSLSNIEVDIRLQENGIPSNFWDGFRKPFLQQKQMLLFQLITKRSMIFAEPRVGKTQVVMDTFRCLNMLNNVKRCMLITDNETACISLYNEYKNYGLNPIIIMTSDASTLNSLVPSSCDVVICSYRTLFASTLFGYLSNKSYEIDYQKINYFINIYNINYVVLDEVHNIKGYETTSSEVSIAITDLVQYVTLLTGTPITTRSNKANRLIALEDIYPYLRIVDRNRFPSFVNFTDEHFTVVYDKRYFTKTYKVKDYKKTESLLYDYYFTCNLLDMGIDNTKRHLVLSVKLPDSIKEQAKIYKGKVEQTQYLSDYDYRGSEFINRKLLIIESLLVSFKTFEKVLIVYQYKVSEQAITKYLTECDKKFIHLKAGSTIDEKKEFLESPLDIALMSIGVGKTALALHRFNIMIFYDVPHPPYSVIDFQQVSARINFPNNNNESNFIYLVHNGMKDSKVIRFLLDDVIKLNKAVFKTESTTSTSLKFGNY